MKDFIKQIEVETVRPALADASVFFLDRLSRATLTLAAEASARGAVVVFEPSGKSTDKLMAEAIALAHVVKYADHRLTGIRGVMASGSAVLLEVQTLGDQGLRYRHRLRRGVSPWMHLKAVPAPRLADTCGAGDWCTAGLIAKAAIGGQEGLHRAGAGGVRAALRYGQALAAWNCGFEGARGGMYAVSRHAFESQITDLLDGRFDGRFDGIDDAPVGSIPTQVVTCPACPPAPPGPSGGTRNRRVRERNPDARSGVRFGMGRHTRALSGGTGPQGQADLPCELQDCSLPAGEIRARDIWRAFQRQYRSHFGKTLREADEPEALRTSEFAWNWSRSGEPAGLSRHDFIEDRLSGLVRQALEEERISQGRAAEILDLGREEMRQRAREWAS